MYFFLRRCVCIKNVQENEKEMKILFTLCNVTFGDSFISERQRPGWRGGGGWGVSIWICVVVKGMVFKRLGVR